MRTIDIGFDPKLGKLVSPDTGFPTDAVPFISFRERILVRLHLVSRKSIQPEDPDDPQVDYVPVVDAESFAAVLESDYASGTTPFIPTSFIEINNVAHWADASPTSGKLCFLLDAFNQSFETRIGSSETISTTKFEFAAYDENAYRVFSARFPFHSLNTMIREESTAVVPPENFYTKIQSDARYVKKSDSDVQLTDHLQLKFSDDSWRYVVGSVIDDVPVLSFTTISSGSATARMFNGVLQLKFGESWRSVIPAVEDGVPVLRFSDPT
jgi:hypothetical protein